jgi:hypothetical protein
LVGFDAIWQMDLERRSAPGNRLGADGTAHPFDEFVSDNEPQPGTLLAARSSFVKAAIQPKDALKLFLAHTDPGVVHFQYDTVIGI